MCSCIATPTSLNFFSRSAHHNVCRIIVNHTSLNFSLSAHLSPSPSPSLPASTHFSNFVLPSVRVLVVAGVFLVFLDVLVVSGLAGLACECTHFIRFIVIAWALLGCCWCSWSYWLSLAWPGWMAQTYIYTEREMCTHFSDLLL